MARSRYDTDPGSRNDQPAESDGGGATAAEAPAVWAPWRARAACRDRVQRPEDDLWFAPTAVRGRSEPDLVAQARLRAAKRVCAGCSVRGECLAFGLATGQRHGIWGGLDEAELTVLRRAGRAVASVRGEAGA